MTIGLNNRNDAVGNGTTADYEYGFKIFAATDLRVTVRDPDTDVETTLTYPTHYSVSGIGRSDGGDISLVDGGFDWLDDDGFLADDWPITIRRVRPLTQETDLRNQDRSFFQQNVEDEFDRQMAIDQQQQDEIDRSVKLPETFAGDVNPELPLPVAGGYLRWNSSASQLEAVAAVADSGDYLASGVSAISIAVAAALNQRVTLLSFMSAATIGDGVTDHSTAIGKAIAAAVLLGVGEIECPYGVAGNYILDDRIIDRAECPNGLRFVGLGRNGRRDLTADGLTWTWTGTAATADSGGDKYCFDIRQPDGSETHVAPDFQNIKFCVSGATAAIRGKLGWFSVNWLALDDGNEYSATDDGLTPNYIQGPTFGRGCNALGGQAGANQTADFLRACKAFEGSVASDMEIRGFRAGLHFKGCDQWTVHGRIYGNTRQIWTERSGNFGNAMKIDVRYLGPCVAGSVTRFICYLEGDTYIDGPVLVEQSSSHETMFWLNSRNIVIDNPILSGDGGNIFNLGANVMEAVCYSPRYSGSGLSLVPGSMAAPTSSDFGADGFAGLTIIDPDSAIESMVRDPQVRVLPGSFRATHLQVLEAENALPLGSTGSTRRRSIFITPLTWNGISTPYGWAGSSVGFADSDGYKGVVRRLPGVDDYGETFKYAQIGNGLENNDWLMIRLRDKMTGVPAVGSFKWHLFRDTTLISSGDLTNTGGTMLDEVFYVQITGASAGETIGIGYHDNGVTDQSLFVAEVYCGVVQAAVANVSTADATDLASVIALANALKVKVNAGVLPALRNAGEIAA